MKKILVLLIALISSLTLIACGEDTESPEVDKDGKKIITFFGWGSTDEQLIFQTMISEFEDLYPEYTVNYQSTTSENYITALAGFKNNPRSMPDVFYMPDVNFVQWVNMNNNIMLDLSDYIASSDVFDLDDLYAEGINAYMFDSKTKTLGTGGIYALPKDLGPNVLAYNKTMTKANGVTIISDPNGEYGYNPETKTLNDKVPMTWAQFIEFCKVNSKGSLDQSNSVVGITHYPLESAYLSNGGKFLTDGNKKVTIANDKYAEALQFVADLSNEYGVMTTAEGQSTQNGMARFSSGLAGSCFIGAWDTPTLWKVDFEWDILYTPVPNQSGDLSNWKDAKREGCSSQSYLGSVGISVYKNSKVLDAAYKLCEFLTVHPIAQKINYELGQAVPNLISMAEGEFLTAQLQDPVTGYNRPENREVYIDMMKNSQRRPQAYTYNATWYDEMWESGNNSLKLYRVWYPKSSSYGSHVDVWSWTTKSMTSDGQTFLSGLESSCQKYLDDYSSKYSW